MDIVATHDIGPLNGSAREGIFQLLAGIVMVESGRRGVLRLVDGL